MCRAHATVRELLAVLVANAEGPTVVDLEAGLENLTRATPRHAGTLLIVLEPYFKSLETGRRIRALAQELPIPRVLGVANKVRSKEEEDAIRAFAASHDIELAAVVPQDEAIAQADIAGRSPVDASPDAPAVAAIRQLAEHL